MLTLNRDAMEAHLTLRGWVPVSYGTAGARQGNLVVYVFRHKADNALLVQHHRLAAADVQRHDLDMWFWSNPTFWKLAGALTEYDRSGVVE